MGAAAFNFLKTPCHANGGFSLSAANQPSGKSAVVSLQPFTGSLCFRRAHPVGIGHAMHRFGAVQLVYKKSFPIDLFCLLKHGRRNEHGRAGHGGRLRTSAWGIDAGYGHGKQVPEKSHRYYLFTCADGPLLQQAVEQARTGSGPQVAKAYSKGVDAEGTMVAEFWFTWSFRAKAR
jgi:hypothetical protein